MIYPKVLLVEDDDAWKSILEEDIREALERIGMLNSQSIKHVGTFSEASKVLQNDGAWNLLITDIVLQPDPEKLGIGLVKQAYKLQVPTIVVSGKCSADEVSFLYRNYKIIDYFGKGEYYRRVDEFYEEIQYILQQTKKNISNQGNNYYDFQLLVTAERKIRASSEQGDKWEDFQLKTNRIKLTLNLIEKRQTDSELLKGLGDELYQALFPIGIRQQLQATIASAEAAKCGVRIRLVFESPELAALPWEFLYDQDTNTFLANNTQTALSRYIDIPLQKRDLKPACLPLKVLLVIASPTDLAQLDADTEERLIRDALMKYINSDQIELDVVHKATTRNINQKLRENIYNVFHFIGHGVFENDQGFIALEDQDGKAKLLDDENFSNLFLGNRGLGLAILNACQGATVSSHRAFAGIAPNLVRRGIPAVIAMQHSVLDTTAKLFADEFYRTIALGYPIDAAIQTTRNAMSIEVGLDQPDFGSPVLYMRAKDGIILSGL